MHEDNGQKGWSECLGSSFGGVADSDANPKHEVGNVQR